MSGYTLAWAAWLGSFAIIEGLALANRRPGDTFSEHTRKAFATYSKPGKATFAVVWVGFAGWYLVHILRG